MCAGVTALSPLDHIHHLVQRRFVCVVVSLCDHVVKASASSSPATYRRSAVGDAQDTVTSALCHLTTQGKAALPALVADGTKAQKMESQARREAGKAQVMCGSMCDVWLRV